MNKLILLASLLLAFSVNATNLVYIPYKAKSLGRNSAGSHTQESWLMGNYQLELIFGEAYGRAVIGHRFNWSWKKDFAFFGLLGGGMNAEDLRKYPDLQQRFTALKPEYVRFRLTLQHSDDLMGRADDYAETNIEIEIFDQQIRGAQADAHNLSSYQGFSFRSPEWGEVSSLAKTEVELSDLRHIGLNKYIGGTGLAKFKRLNEELNFSYYKKAKVKSMNYMEIRWPDTEMQDIFREYSRREYIQFKGSISRDQLYSELTKDADSQGFWNSVNINLDKYKTADTGQKHYLGSVKSKAKAKYDTEHQLFTLMAERAGYSNKDAGLSRAIVASFSEGELNRLVSSNIPAKALKHNIQLSGSIQASTNNLSLVNVYMNDVLKLRAKRRSSSFDTVLIYNYGWNEVKVGLKYRDGMELIDRYYTLREGDKVPLRATLFWDYDDYDNVKSDVDLAISSDNSCNKEDLLVYHEKKQVSLDGNQYALDVDNTEGFGPENISIYDYDGQKYYYVCLKNHSQKVPAQTKVVIFQNEQIVPIVDDNYVYEYRFYGDEQREWRVIPGIFQSPRGLE